jgi:two-component system response regulator MprA
MRILVVDDERAVRESLRRALELEGYDVELASDGEEALRRLDEPASPDAAFSTCSCRGSTGYAVGSSV